MSQADSSKIQADNSKIKVAFVGSGNMSRSIISGLVSTNYQSKNIIASNPTIAKLNKLKSEYGIQVTQDNLATVEFAKVVILSVKPQVMPQVLKEISSCDLSDKLIISVAAGFKTENISKHLHSNNTRKNIAIIRAMPNTPALIGVGATGLFATKEVSSQQKLIAESIFESVGETTWIENESDMDTVTAISGSGPAYFLFMMESMLEQAMAAGLSQEQARNLIIQTAKGTAILAQKSSKQSLTEMRNAVTSPGGTTAAAIEHLTQQNFQKIIKGAVNAAIERGKELGS
jgi:pyrroline-5-carboxylate reductase